MIGDRVLSGAGPKLVHRSCPAAARLPRSISDAESAMSVRRVWVPSPTTHNPWVAAGGLTKPEGRHRDSAWPNFSAQTPLQRRQPHPQTARRTRRPDRPHRPCSPQRRAKANSARALVTAAQYPDTSWLSSRARAAIFLHSGSSGRPSPSAALTNGCGRQGYPISRAQFLPVTAPLARGHRTAGHRRAQPARLGRCVESFGRAALRERFCLPCG
jgi:hypothetical protein